MTAVQPSSKLFVRVHCKDDGDDDDDDDDVVVVVVDDDDGDDGDDDDDDDDSGRVQCCDYDCNRRHRQTLSILKYLEEQVVGKWLEALGTSESCRQLNICI